MGYIGDENYSLMKYTFSGNQKGKRMQLQLKNSNI